MGASSNGFLSPFDMTLLVFENFLLAVISRQSRLILYLVPSYSRHETRWSSKRPGFFFHRPWCFKATIWAMGKLIAVGSIMVSRLFGGQNSEIYMYINFMWAHLIWGKGGCWSWEAINSKLAHPLFFWSFSLLQFCCSYSGAQFHSVTNNFSPVRGSVSIRQGALADLL